MGTNGTTVQPVALIQVALLPNGQIQCQAQVPNPLIGLGMLDFAKESLMKQLTTPKSPIEVAPPGMRVAH